VRQVELGLRQPVNFRGGGFAIKTHARIPQDVIKPSVDFGLPVGLVPFVGSHQLRVIDGFTAECSERGQELEFSTMEATGIIPLHFQETTDQKLVHDFLEVSPTEQISEDFLFIRGGALPASQGALDKIPFHPALPQKRIDLLQALA